MEPKTTARLVARPSRGYQLHERVRERLHQYPYLAVATGAGLGFILAGGLTAHRTRRVLAAIGSLALFSPIWSRLITTGLTVLQPRRT